MQHEDKLQKYFLLMFSLLYGVIEEQQQRGQQQSFAWGFCNMLFQPCPAKAFQYSMWLNGLKD